MSRLIELRDVDVLMAVVEAGSFRSASHALGVNASAISRRLRDLEDRLGASLFERRHSGVRLTDAGQVFHDRARDAVAQLDGAIRSVGSAGRGGNGSVALGLTCSLASQFLGQLIRGFKAGHPQIAVTVSEGSQHSQLAALTEGSIDVAFLLGNPKPGGCDVEALWSEPVFAALASTDARVSQTDLGLTALADDLFIVNSEAPGPEVHDFIIRMLSAPGFHPRIKQYDVGRESLMMMVGLGFGTSLVCGSARRIAYPNVSFISIGDQVIDFTAAWSSTNDNPSLRRLLTLARRLAREERQNGVASRTLGLSP